MQLLQSGPGRNASALAKACKVARRTIFRDLAALRDAGLPLKYDPKTDRYSASSWLLPATQLTTEESRALSGLALEFGYRGKLPFYDAAFNASQKIERGLPAPVRRAVSKIVRFIDVHSAEINELDDKAGYFHQLIEATVQRRAVKLVYGCLTQWETIQTTLRPYHLLFKRHSWYVLGRSSLHGEIRTFNLDRIRSLEPLRERYTIPKSFDLDKHLGNAWQMIPDPGPDSHVVVRFSSLVAQNVAEVTWHKTQQTKLLADGSLEFHATVSGLTEISWWLLGYGDQAEVIKPAKLRRIIAQRIRKMAAIYKEEC